MIDTVQYPPCGTTRHGGTIVAWCTMLLAHSTCGDDARTGQFGTGTLATDTASGAEASSAPGSHDDAGERGGERGGERDGSAGGSTEAGGEPSGSGVSTSESSAAGEQPVFDVASPGSGGGIGRCGMPVDVEQCVETAPPDSFEPVVQWTATGMDSVVLPLVANLTDDNGDGNIDVYDTPDVVIVGSVTNVLHVLDGATGAEHFSIPSVSGLLTPALGDIDEDGLPEIVTGDTTVGLPPTTLAVYEHDGTFKFRSAQQFGGAFTAIALADLDNDGDVEILAGDTLYDHLGNALWAGFGYVTYVIAPTIADLDGDGDQEVIFGNKAYQDDGTLYFDVPSVAPDGVGLFPQIGNFDGDDHPEVVVGHRGGVTILEHEGTIKVSAAAPHADGSAGVYPGTIHDFDGDCVSEFAVSSGNFYTVYEPDLSVLWSAPVRDASGVAGGTAFDFLGDGVSEAMYGDEIFMFVFNGINGSVFFQTPRSSGTAIEYPTVADIDNDGSAEIVVVSNSGPWSVQVIQDQQNRWIQARRIWNQHTYHVTNVNEDGTIPQFEEPNWHSLNTFRTNAQIEGGSVCRPTPPEG